MFASWRVYICALWKGVMRLCGESMNTWMPGLPRIAYSAAVPVSPEVAPRMFSAFPSKRLPRSCIATSLKASVGPCDRPSRCRPGSSVLSGVTSSVPKTAGL
jgi:hypothetical protein